MFLNIDQLSKVHMRPFSLFFVISLLFRYGHIGLLPFSFLIVLRSAYKPAKTVEGLLQQYSVKGITTDINLKEELYVKRWIGLENLDGRRDCMEY